VRVPFEDLEISEGILPAKSFPFGIPELAVLAEFQVLPWKF